MNTNVWQITEFAEKISKAMQERYGDPNLGVHYNTVDKWFKTLEQKGIHYINRVAGEKVYDEMDFEIGCFIFEKRKEKWRLDVIFDNLPEYLEVRPFPNDFQDETSPVIINEEKIMEKVHKTINKEIENVKVEILDAIRKITSTELKSMLPEPKSPEQERLDRFNDSITKWRIEVKLEEEAIQEWRKLPDSERFKKVGFFRKEEDLVKKDEFIRQYKKEHMEKLLKEAYDIDME